MNRTHGGEFLASDVFPGPDVLDSSSRTAGSYLRGAHFGNRGYAAEARVTELWTGERSARYPVHPAAVLRLSQRARAGSGVNRDEVRDAANIMGHVVPAVIDVMMAAANEVWGDPCYPVVD